VAHQQSYGREVCNRQEDLGPAALILVGRGAHDEVADDLSSQPRNPKKAKHYNLSLPQ
jgi:hypothetical protein